MFTILRQLFLAYFGLYHSMLSLLAFGMDFVQFPKILPYWNFFWPRNGKLFQDPEKLSLINIPN